MILNNMKSVLPSDKVKSILFTFCLFYSISSCINSSDSENALNELDQAMEKSQSTIDSAKNEINEILKNRQNNFAPFERDSSVHYNETILEYVRE